jgi:hypothetical protein
VAATGLTCAAAGAAPPSIAFMRASTDAASSDWLAALGAAAAGAGVYDAAGAGAGAGAAAGFEAGAEEAAAAAHWRYLAISSSGVT